MITRYLKNLVFLVISAHKDTNFTEIKSILQSALKTGFGIKIETKTTVNSSFEDGHCATIIFNGNGHWNYCRQLILKLLKIIKFVYLQLDLKYLYGNPFSNLFNIEIKINIIPNPNNITPIENSKRIF